MAKDTAGRRRPRPIMVFINLLITAVVAVVALSPYIHTEEGSFLGSVLSPLHDWFEAWLNPFTGTSFSQYGLIPVCLLCLVNTVLAFMGSGLLQFLLRCAFFYSLYLLGTWFRGRNTLFTLPGEMPWLYPVVCVAMLALSVLLLVLIRRIRRKDVAAAAATDAEAAPPSSAAGPEVQESGEEEDSGKEEGAEEKVEEPYVRDTARLKGALNSLQDVRIPEFQAFPNYGSSSTLSSVDRGIYDVAEREARIRFEEQKRREAEIEKQRLEEERLRRIAEQEERERLEAEENRRRLQNMFKPRTLMKRLNEDAQAEKSFPTYGARVPDIDYGISAPVPPKSVQEEERDEAPAQVAIAGPVSVKQTEPAFRPTAPAGFVPSDIPVAQQIPLAQMRGMEDVPPRQQPVQSQGIFREASEEADREAEIIERKRQAELEKKHLDEIHDLERRRREAEEAARKAEEELARTREEVRRRQEEQEALATAEARKAGEKQRLEEKKEEDDGLSTEDFNESDKAAKAKGPDIDYVSGVGGLKSAMNGNPYLIDRQKFDYKFPPESILKHYPTSAMIYEDPENDPDGRIIVETFRQFRIETSLIGVQHGPTFTLYELTLAKGIKVSSVLGYSDNIAMELSVDDVRILAPIPGKSAIGVEVPNKKRDTIGFDVMMPALKSKFYKIPMVLGKNITGDSIVIDVAKTPHLLVAGTTGSGKSVCINGLICSVLYTKTPKEVRMILVDPKMVELSLYNGIPHLLTPVITDAKKALKAMNFVVDEMERRMQLFKNIGAKKIEEYNEKIVEKKMACVKLPYIMVIIDEFADLMLAVGKELEQSIKRITAVARFCGIHLILATQRPSADVITGIIKSNIPTQIAFAVSNSMNSRIIIDQLGAEKLLGRGDMLYNNPEARQPQRIQGAFIDSEIEEIVEFVKTQGEPDYIDESYFEDDEEEEEEAEEAQGGGEEDLFSRAWKIVSDRGEASASYLQRRLNIGYNRAANLIEQMEDAGYIGPARGSKPREILKLYGSD